MLTTEVIGWARGVVAETVLAAQIMHLAQRQARPPKHIDPGLVTTKDESMRAPSEEELRTMQSQISDRNWRLFADADWLYALNGERFVRETNMYAVFEQLDVDGASHAFYLGKELMKATIARGLGKSYRQEGPLEWGILSFPEPRREDSSDTFDEDDPDPTRHRPAPQPVRRDRRLRRRRGRRAGLRPDHPDGLDDVVQGAMFPRGPDGLANTAFWVGGIEGARRRGRVRGGAEAVLRSVQAVDHARLRRLQHHRGGRRRDGPQRGRR